MIAGYMRCREGGYDRRLHFRKLLHCRSSYGFFHSLFTAQLTEQHNMKKGEERKRKERGR